MTQIAFNGQRAFRYIVWINSGLELDIPKHWCVVFLNIQELQIQIPDKEDVHERIYTEAL